ncbi:protein kinase [Streptomyces sp. ISL-36]|uniref:serine/threonine-protein kinase n=1 Tax=Streptomyces sp. ISL-36 TaxID=2819182 RepID=UPI001BE986D5|nr:serine/threonine-protein kinase [Streptomyces sp. ISL-36]MBT2440834.1 protein kinase [Streptomyces sp. ISL-36]
MPLESGDPRRIGAFKLLGVLGSGGMGRVYLGAVPGKFAAVKRVLPILAEDADFLSHFGHELDNLARLPGRASARLLASDRTAQPPWFATEYIPGITLNEAIRLNGGPLSGAALWRLLRDAAAGLRAVHEADMVHRDLKPSNVMLTTDGLTLIDFGVARAADQSRLTRTGMVIGTPAYMAPEQAVAERELTGAADVFALGSLLLYAANGRPPFGDGSGPGLLYRVVHGDPDFGRLAEDDPELVEVVRSCLAKDPAARPTAAELVGLTGDHAEAAPWPAVVAERIAERAAFAAEAPTAEQLAEPEEAGQAGPGGPAGDIGTIPLTPQGSKEPATASPDPAVATGPVEPGRRRERRNRFVMLAVPVVVATGTTLTVALGPYEIGRLGAGPRPSDSPSVVVSQPPPGGPASVTPSSRPPSSGPAGSPSGSPSGGPHPVPPTTGGAGGGGAAGGTLPGSGSGSGGGSGGGSGSGSGGGSTATGGGGSSTTSGGSSTSSSSGGSGGGSTRPAPPPTTGGSAPSGTYSLKNASNGYCLAEFTSAYSSMHTQACGSPASNGGSVSYAWTYSAGSDGTFLLVNKKTGHCLESRGYAGVQAVACSGSNAQYWRIGATKSAGRTIQNVGDSLCMATSSLVVAVSCNAGDSAQLWRNISPV